MWKVHVKDVGLPFGVAVNGLHWHASCQLLAKRNRHIFISLHIAVWYSEEYWTFESSYWIIYDNFTKWHSQHLNIISVSSINLTYLTWSHWFCLDFSTRFLLHHKKLNKTGNITTIGAIKLHISFDWFWPLWTLLMKVAKYGFKYKTTSSGKKLCDFIKLEVKYELWTLGPTRVDLQQFVMLSTLADDYVISHKSLHRCMLLTRPVPKSRRFPLSFVLNYLKIKFKFVLTVVGSPTLAFV